MVLHLFNGDALYGQRVEIRHFILPFVSSGYEFCFRMQGHVIQFSQINQTVKTILQRGMESV